MGIVTFASPGRYGISLSEQEAHDAGRVGLPTFLIIVSTTLVITLAWFMTGNQSTHPMHPEVASFLLIGLNLLSLGLFGLLIRHALLHNAEQNELAEKMAVESDETDLQQEVAVCTPTRLHWLIIRVLGEIVCSLGIALGGVVVMVQSGEAIANKLHMPNAILSLLILAVATSLPNLVVAFLLARTSRASASVEEIFSSNSINAVLGISIPLLFLAFAEQRYSDDCSRCASNGRVNPAGTALCTPSQDQQTCGGDVGTELCGFRSAASVASLD